MWIANQLCRWQCGIISLVLILATAVVCLAVPGSEVPVSLRLVQTINKAELVSLEPFNSQGLLAVRAGDVVQLWDSRTGQLKFSLDGHGILRTNFSSDGATFITSSREKPAGLLTKLWDAQTGRLKITVSGLIIYGPTVNESGVAEIVTLMDRNELKFWNAETGELIKTVHAYKDTFSNSRISYDGRVVVRYGGKKGYLWETGTGRLIAELKPPETRYVPYYTDLKLEGATFSPDSRLVATEDSMNNIELWDTSTGRLRAVFEGHASTVYTLAFSRDGRWLASASRDGTARIWDVQSGRLRVMLPAGKEIATRVIFNSDGTLLAVGYHTHARVWEVATRQLHATLAPHSDINKLVLFGTYWDGVGIRLSADDRFLLTIGDKSVNVWTMHGSLHATLKGARAPLALAPGDNFLATTGPNGSILVWAIQ